MKKYILRITIIVLVSLFVLNIYLIRSILVMIPYNMINFRSSFVKEENIEIEIPKEVNLEWYPLMNTFNAKYFSSFIDKDVDLIVYYTFGAFKGRYSDIFRESSPTYSSFYGAYVVKNNTPEDFLLNSSEDLIIEDIKKILIYDYKYLVLKPLGYKGKVNVDFEILEIKENDTEVSFITKITMNGLKHSYKKFNSNYLQYGTPDNIVKEEFKTIKTYGKFVVQKSEGDIKLIYYMINQNLPIIKGWDV